MSRQFHIERIGNLKWFANQLKTNTFPVSDKVFGQYTNYALIYEDYRTIIELNKTIEDLLTQKYMFFKIPDSSTVFKRKKQELEDIKLEVETYNTLLIQSLFTTCVVTYAKWFTQSSGGDKTKLEAKIVFKDCSAPIQKTHEQVMQLRHLYFVHSGPTLHEIAFPIYLKNPHTGKEDLSFFTDKKRLPSLSEVRKFNRLFLKAIEFVYNKIKTLEPKALEAVKKKMQSK